MEHIKGFLHHSTFRLIDTSSNHASSRQPCHSPFSPPLYSSYGHMRSNNMCVWRLLSHIAEILILRPLGNGVSLPPNLEQPSWLAMHDADRTIHVRFPTLSLRHWKRISFWWPSQVLLATSAVSEILSKLGIHLSHVWTSEREYFIYLITLTPGTSHREYPLAVLRQHQRFRIPVLS